MQPPAPARFGLPPGGWGVGVAMVGGRGLFDVLLRAFEQSEVAAGVDLAVSMARIVGQTCELELHHHAGHVVGGEVEVWWHVAACDKPLSPHAGDGA